MDPATGRIYAEDEIPALDEETQKRLIRGELEELQAMSALLTQAESMNGGHIPEDPPEHFYPVNRAARRKAEKRDRATRKRDPRG